MSWQPEGERMWLRYWYEADSRPPHRFRYGLLAFDA
jgi:hypothetical protein